MFLNLTPYYFRHYVVYYVGQMSGGSSPDFVTCSTSNETRSTLSRPTGEVHTTFAEKADSMNITSQAVGGVLGGLLTLAVIISVLVVFIAWVVIVRRRRSKQGAENCTDDGLGYHNAVYAGKVVC